MKLLEVMEICKQRGHPLTARSIYKAGEKYGFLVDNESRKKYGRWDFDKDKFYAWLDKADEKIPDGWVTINQLHDVLGVSLRQAYILSNEPDSGAKVIGVGRGVVYVNVEQIRKVIERREQEHKEKFGGK